ncbi:MAG: enoyl-CoA hydratase/isomerase family protein [Xanthomonadales bacterium]|nr:enoyl-CoA hydratase/isomerase family protein [Xanthomonadales bacterium]
MNAVNLFQHDYTGYRVGTCFDAKANNTLWITLPTATNGGPPCFSRDLIHELMSLLQTIKQRGATWPSNGALQPIHYIVMKSAHPDYFSLGGDLAYFHDCIQRGDRESLHDYSATCADMLHDWSSLLGNYATTIALVQGRAFGGGFETALAADILVAEEHSEFAFPEILFGLFPCTGGMSLLAHRIGARAAERMLGDARVHAAPALKERGVVDEICSRGQGERAVEALIANHARQRQARLMLQRSRQRLENLNRRELQTVVDEWTETAMALDPRDLRVMDSLVRLQRGRPAG